MWRVVFFLSFFLSFSLPFSLSDEEQGHFEIDSQSGDIRSTEEFTQNAKAQYTLTVVATDNGAVPLEETAVIHLQVPWPSFA